MKYPDLFNPDISRVGVAESRMYNLVAAQLMTETVKSSFGPRGMEKVYIDILGEPTITKHGGAFLRKLDTDHPAAKTITEAVNTVDTHVGDGTIGTAILMGALLRHAQELLNLGIPTAVIIGGFEMGLDAALQTLDDIKIRSDPTDRRLMGSLLDTCLDGKAISDSLSEESQTREIILDAVCAVADPARRTISVDDIKIEEKPGNSSDIELVRGTVLDKPPDSPDMPGALYNAKVLLLNDPLEAVRTRTESEIVVESADNMGRFLKQETDNVMSVVRSVVDSGAGLVVSRKGIGGLAQEHFAKYGIMSVRRAKYNDLWWLEKSTSASTCRDVTAISEAELGLASRVYERNVGGDRMIFVESAAPRSVTILLRANSKSYLDEFHRTAKNAIFVLRNFIMQPFIVFGGGSCEARIAQQVREYSDAVPGREQLAMRRFADALEEIPLALARNAGMSTLDALPQLRAMLATAKPGRWFGINSRNRKVDDMSRSGITDTAAVKEQMLKTAVETANMILNVDDVFMKDLIDNTHCHIDGTVHAHKDPGRNHNHWEQEGLEQRQMHHYY